MDLTDNNLKDPESGMGNEISQADGVKQSVGGEGRIGQFHRVLVESEYSIPDFKEPIEDLSRDPATNDIHEQATLKIRGERDTELKADDYHVDSDAARQIKPDVSSDSDYSLIEECKALITEAADRAVQRSLSRTSTTEQVTDLDEEHAEETVEVVQVLEQAKSVSVLEVEPVKPETSNESTYSEISVDDELKQPEVKSQKTESEAAEPIKKRHIDLTYALKCGVITASAEDIFDSSRKNDKGKKRKSKSAENIFQREVIESVKEHFDNEDNLKAEKGTPEAKRSKGSFIAKMFKFSKKKQRTDADGSIEVKNQMKKDIVEESASENNTLSVKSADVEISNGGQSSNTFRQVKRLNSLDSGIVVDKVNEQPNNIAVEYAVVQKTKIKDLYKSNGSGSLNVVTTEIIKTVPKGIEPEQDTSANDATTSEQNDLFINGDKADEDYVYVNERPVDVDGLEESEKTTVSEKILNVGSAAMNNVKEKSIYDDERQSNVSTDSGTSSGSKIQRSDVLTQPEKAKLKKKSWSFQLVGKKKQSVEPESESVVSMDPNASHTETKKPKWRFGKFSFRRGSDDVSSSSPNLHKAGIPEGEEVTLRKKPEDKKKMKLKNLKAKKEKKKSLGKNRSSLDTRSTSLIDIGRGELLEPRSRRSIVEEDLCYTQTDVFEGVSLSDLSQDEDGEVSSNPAGAPINDKKNGSKKAIECLSDKGAEKVIAVIRTETEKQADQYSFESGTSDSKTEKNDEAKLTKNNLIEDHTVKDTDVRENAVTQPGSAIEDEYVSIVSAKAESLKSVPEDSEYAQVVKTKSKLGQDTDVKNVQSFKSTVSEQVLKVENVEVSKDEKSEGDKQIEINSQDKMADNENIAAEVKKSCETSFSNMIYSDEEFRASLASFERAKIEPEDESDAYVELQQIVEDFGSERNKTCSIGDTSSEKEGVQSIEIEEVKTEKFIDGNVIVTEEISEKAECISQVNENIKPVLNEIIDKCDSTPDESLPIKPEVIRTTEKTETEPQVPVTHVSKDGSVIVVKDVGVQVPDIYMPLDKNTDFGFTASNIPCVSIGIQVTDKDLEVEHVVVSLKTDDVIQPLKEHSPAFF